MIYRSDSIMNINTMTPRNKTNQKEFSVKYKQLNGNNINIDSDNVNGFTVKQSF